MNETNKWHNADTDKPANELVGADELPLLVTPDEFNIF